MYKTVGWLKHLFCTALRSAVYPSDDNLLRILGCKLIQPTVFTLH